MDNNPLAMKSGDEVPHKGHWSDCSQCYDYHEAGHKNEADKKIAELTNAVLKKFIPDVEVIP